MTEWSAEYFNEISSLLATLVGIREAIKRRRIEGRTDENEKRFRQRIDEISTFIQAFPDIHAEMQCAGEEESSECVDDDDLWYLAEELRGMVAEETAILERECPVIGFEIQPLQDGRVLLRFWASDHGYRFTKCAQAISGDCFAALAAMNPK